MPDILFIILYTGGAGSCMLIGGLLARYTPLLPKWHVQELRHFIIALGGGIMLGAVAVVLVPEGVDSLQGSMFAVPLLMSGGLVFFLLERRLGVNRHEHPQVLGMVLDYVPEAIALGGMMALEPTAAALLALLMGLQNLPEGFNAYREMAQLEDGNKPPRTIRTMIWLTGLGPAAGLCGYFILRDQPEMLGGLMLLASGGILYLIFQDIAPQSKLEKHWAPPLGAVCGFCVALFSDLLISGASL